MHENKSRFGNKKKMSNSSVFCHDILVSCIAEITSNKSFTDNNLIAFFYELILPPQFLILWVRTQR